MTEADFQEIYQLSNQKIARTRLTFKRYLYPQVDWSDPLICLKGARGVGKTTLLLQKIKESEERRTTLYVSLDSPPANFQRNRRCTLNADKHFLVNRV